jgi:hypothetical protein
MCSEPDPFKGKKRKAGSGLTPEKYLQKSVSLLPRPPPPVSLPHKKVRDYAAKTYLYCQRNE